ncbi:PRP38 family-domain-containing protein [Geranomyces variabilis]|nr:PRP38 family-domain-containing protein [Geranomyces variabilis]
MANRTVTEATNIHGTNPQFLIEKIIRTRIYDSLYWKESCFALTAETIIDKAVALQSIGGQYGNQKPTEFLCLALKMLQLQPEKEILRLYIQNEDYKYLRALGAFYLRLTGTAVEIYRYLEPLLLDFRKLRRRNISGDFELTYMDEFVDDLLRSDRVCDTILPRITKRHILEETGELEPRVSPLEEDLEDEDEEGVIDSSDGVEKAKAQKASWDKEVERGNGNDDRRRRTRDGSGSRSPARDRQSPPTRSRGNICSRSPSRSRYRRSRSRSASRTRHRRQSSYSPDRSPPARRHREDDRDYRRRDASPRRQDVSHERYDSYRRSSRGRGSRRRDHDDDSDYERNVDRRRRDDRHRSSRHRSRSRSTDRHSHRRKRRRSRSRTRSRSRSRDRRDYRPDDNAHGPASNESKRGGDDGAGSDHVADIPAAAGETSTTGKIAVSSRKVDALFKKKSSDKKKSGSSRGDDSGSGAGGGGGGGGAQESMSVEETNKMRAALGLKPLKM